MQLPYQDGLKFTNSFLTIIYNKKIRTHFKKNQFSDVSGISFYISLTAHPLVEIVALRAVFLYFTKRVTALLRKKFGHTYRHP